MLDVIISLEATCDLDKETIIKNDLQVVDMNYQIGDEEFNTSVDDVVSSKLYEKMAQKQKTKTSQINEYYYEEHFVKLLKENKPILHLALSFNLSGTGEVSKRVADKLNKTNKNQIYVVNTLCGCSGQGILALMVKDFAKTCNNMQELLDYVEELKHKMRHYYTVDTLSFLANGGRIDPKKAFLGNLLNIKPVMHLSKIGVLEGLHKVISRKKSIISLAELVAKTYDERNIKYCYIAHANCLDDANSLKDRIEKLTSLKPLITNLGPIIGSHSGPGTLAVFFVGKDNR